MSAAIPAGPWLRPLTTPGPDVSTGSSWLLASRPVPGCLLVAQIFSIFTPKCGTGLWSAPVV